MGYDPQTCFNNLLANQNQPCPADIGGALSYHCQEVSASYHSWCVSKDLYTPISWWELYNNTLCTPTEYDPNNPTKCDPHVFASLDDMNNWKLAQPDPSIWSMRPCYCCCACFAYGTPVAITSDKTKPIEKFVNGDIVLAGSIDYHSGALNLSWKNAKVKMSTGSPPQPSNMKNYPPMIYINYGIGLELICTLDQVFLLSTGKFKHASTITLNDQLTSPEGKAVKINSIKMAQYSGGIHHIATSVNPSPNPNGHLLNTNGVVSGDYSLQISTSKLGDQLEVGPHIGTKEYHDLHTGKDHQVFHYSHHEKKESHHDENDHHQIHSFARDSSPIPAKSESFVGLEQALEIDANASFRAPFDPVNIAVVHNLFEMFGAFYPDIEFYLNNTSFTPNCNSFVAYGKKHVVLSAKLTRVDTMYWEGIAMILAQAVACFDVDKQGVPTNKLIPRSIADFLSTKMVLRTVFPFTALNVFEAGIKQIKELFSYVKIDNGGNPNHKRRNPSLDCRVKTFAAGAYGGNLPECAGGKPVDISFMVVGANYDMNQGLLTVTFNDDVDPDTGSILENYVLTPSGQVEGVEMGPDPKSVTLHCGLEANTMCVITVNDVKSTSGKTVMQGNNFARFMTEA